MLRFVVLSALAVAAVASPPAYGPAVLSAPSLASYGSYAASAPILAGPAYGGAALTGLSGIGGLGLGAGLGLAGAAGLGLGGGAILAAGPAIATSAVIPAAVQTRQTIQEVAVPSTGIVTPTNIEVGANPAPINILFRSASSLLNVQQLHEGAPGSVQESASQDEPHRLSHSVTKPIIQEVREVIVPMRRITQEITPVQEEINTVVARGQPTPVAAGGAVLAAGPAVGAVGGGALLAAGPAVATGGAILGAGQVIGGGLAGGALIGNGGALIGNGGALLAGGYGSGKYAAIAAPVLAKKY